MAKTYEGDFRVKKVRVCILQSDGVNCDNELFYAFKKFGGSPKFVHVNELRNKTKTLKNFDILALPGGFSYGDDVVSGKIWAIELISFLRKEIENFRKRGGLIIGICNGFQVLIRTGLLPFGNLGKMDATLSNNDSGHFECRWVDLKTETHSTSSGQESKCVFLKGNYNLGHFSVNHGEGKFFSSPDVIKKIEDENLIVFRYVDKNGNPTQNYPQNPNGSINAIAGVTDPTGRVLGLMPHPEKFVDITQYPNWRRDLPAARLLAGQGRQGKLTKPHGAFIFEDMIKFVKGNL